jgi:carboxylesterase
MRPLAEYLGARGYHCVVPLLPGHGTTLEDLHCATWQDWVRAAEKELARLQAQHATVCVVGFSLGTLVVAHLAALHPELAGVALLSPAIAVSNRFLWLAPLIHPLVKTFPKSPGNLRAPDAASHIWSYDRWSTHALGELWRLQRQVKSELASVAVPALVVYTTRDRALAPDAGQRTLARWGCPDKELCTLHESDHVVTLDIERDAVFERVAAFFSARCPHLSAARVPDSSVS